MRINIGSHPLFESLDQQAVEVLFEGHARLEPPYLVFNDSMSEFVIHRVHLLETEVRVLVNKPAPELVDTGYIDITWSIPVHQIYLNTRVSTQLFTPSGIDVALIHATIHGLRAEGRYSEAERMESILTELTWFILARRYLNARRQLRNIQETVDDLAQQLHPATEMEKEVHMCNRNIWSSV